MLGQPLCDSPKKENENFGHFCGKHAMGTKTNEMVIKKYVVCVFFVATCGNEVISGGGHKKTQTYGTIHAFEALYKTSF